MNDKILSGAELAPKSGNAKQLIILLHGFGSDGNDLIDFAPAFAEALPDAHFISPNAPFPCEMSPSGYQWFSLETYEPSSMHKGASKAAPILNKFIDDKLEELGLNDNYLALIGFSQGTMMSLFVSLRREKQCAGVLGYSGALLDFEPLEDIVKSKPPICLIHGEMDSVVPFAALAHAEDKLSEIDIVAETHSRNMLAHGIDPEGINIGKGFLNRAFR